MSNFLPEHLDRIANLGSTIPAVNQIEFHPALQQRDIVAANDRLGIRTEAYSPLAQGGVLSDPAITRIAARVGKSPAQVVIRWHLQQGRIAIPKSTTPARIAENFDVFDFALTDDDLAAIDRLDRGERTGADPAEMFA